jgi:hypothetical protein
MKAVILALVLIVCPGLAFGQFEGTYQVAIKKQEEKKSPRWSLADWLAQKQTNQAQNLWLAKNSHSSVFESYLELRSQNYTLGSSGDVYENHNNFGGAFALYAGVAGLKGDYEHDLEKRGIWQGSLNIRLLGRALQDTHINLEYGLRGMTVPVGVAGSVADDRFQNQFGGVSTNLYLTKFFGLEGSYRRLLPASSEQKTSLEGEISSGGAFIDFSLIRVFGFWRHEYLKREDLVGVPSTETRDGYGGGLRIYF